MKKVILENNEYELIEDNGGCFSETEIKEKYTDYFEEFDYINAIVTRQHNKSSAS